VGTGLHLAAGLGTVGLAGYVYVAVVGRVFEGPGGAAGVSALVSLYLLINIIGPGIFTALEQETSRAVSAAAARQTSVRPPAVRAALMAAVAVAVLVVVVLVAWPLVLGQVFGGNAGLLVALLVAIAGSAGVYWTRGVLGGQQRFRAYSSTFYVEGLVRLVPLLVLLVVADRDPFLFAIVFAAASAVAALAVWPYVRLPAGPSGGDGLDGMRRSFGLLVGATALSQTIANLAPVVVTYRLPDDPVTASVFGSTFVLARVPLFLFAPVLAVLLPMLTRDVAAARFGDFARHLGRTVGGLVLLGGLGVAVGALFGPWAVETLFNSATRPSGTTIALLACATVLMMLALVLQPALVALGRQQAVTSGWVLGAVVFLALLACPFDPITGALAAQLAGPLVVAVYLGVTVLRELAAARHPVPAD
jgi:O-antigen/teichoic acid export membrane protein